MRERERGGKRYMFSFLSFYFKTGSHYCIHTTYNLLFRKGGPWIQRLACLCLECWVERAGLTMAGLKIFFFNLFYHSLRDIPFKWQCVASNIYVSFLGTLICNFLILLSKVEAWQPIFKNRCCSFKFWDRASVFQAGLDNVTEDDLELLVILFQFPECFP